MYKPMTTLPELSRRVSEAEGPSRELDAAVFEAVIGKIAMGDPDQWQIGPYAIWGAAHGPRPIPRYTASLDAVAALIAEKLPMTWAWTLGKNLHHQTWGASVNNLDADGAPYSVSWGGNNQSPALALLAAALLAIHERGDHR